MVKTLARKAVYWGLLHLLTTLAVDFAIFSLSHLPPEHFDFSQPILWLSKIYAILIHPRIWLRMLWPFETTPLLVIYLVWAANSYLWGFAVASLRHWHQSPVKRG